MGTAYTTSNAATHAYLWQSGSGMQDIGTLGGNSFAYGINNMAQVVGFSVVGGNDHAFLWKSGAGMQDLNNLVASSAGWMLGYAQAINDNGQIAGYGINPSGQTHAFLLTPIPEPSTLALLGISAVSLIGCGLWRRRRKK